MQQRSLQQSQKHGVAHNESTAIFSHSMQAHELFVLEAQKLNCALRRALELFKQVRCEPRCCALVEPFKAPGIHCESCISYWSVRTQAPYVQSSVR